MLETRLLHDWSIGMEAPTTKPQSRVRLGSALDPKKRHASSQRNAFRRRALLAYEQVGGAKKADEALRLAAGHSPQLLWNAYIADVNAALRHVAANEQLTLLDYESIMLRLPTAHAHFMDGMHPLVRLLALDAASRSSGLNPTSDLSGWGQGIPCEPRAGPFSPS